MILKRNPKPETRTTIFFSIIFIFLGGCVAPKSNRVCFKGQCYKVEVVYKHEDMMRGLQFRKSLPPDAGMLFVFGASGKHGFWMKDTLIPLDIIWLDQNRRVTHIAPNLKPCPSDPCPNYTPAADSLYVLEVNANQAQRLGIKINDQATIAIDETTIK